VYRLVVVVLLAGCGARAPTKTTRPLGDDITLYRDWALIRQRIALDVTSASATFKVKIPAGVSAEQLIVVDRGGLAITAIHLAFDPKKAVDDADAATPPPPAKPAELALDVQAKRAGRYSIVIGYITNRIAWDVAYTMTATPERDHATLRGALAIRNTSGIALRAGHARLIDAELGPWRGKSAEQLAAALTGAAQGSTPPAAPRELGSLVIGEGETRVELLRASTRAMSSVLVYDPIGTKLDNPGATPLRDVRMGAGAASSRVTESFEVQRDKEATAGLPAGPVRLLERRANGSFIVLGESRLFDVATRVAEVDTIAVGTAEGVAGTRERRELTIDDERHRVVEEFVITLVNKRPTPASVLIREHLYRGQNWTLAYPQANTQGVIASKEGPQQISLRTVVPARSQTKILYVVVYTWGQ